jgi:mannose-1-phosphate guanylyltransferase
MILAGGDGMRLRSLTQRITGDERPKQFCPVIGGRTLLEQTWRRTGQVAPPERTLLVFTRRHERFYEPL